MPLAKRLAWCAMNAFAAFVGLVILTGLYDEQVAYPVGGPWSHPVFRYGSRFDTLTWLDLMATAVALLAIGITWWRTRPGR